MHKDPGFGWTRFDGQLQILLPELLGLKLFGEDRFGGQSRQDVWNVQTETPMF